MVKKKIAKHHYIQFAHGKLNFEQNLMLYCEYCKRYIPKNKFHKHIKKHLISRNLLDK